MTPVVSFGGSPECVPESNDVGMTKRAGGKHSGERGCLHVGVRVETGEVRPENVRDGLEDIQNFN